MQLLFAAAAVALIVGRFREVLFRRELDAKPYIEALRSAVYEERFDAAHRLVDAARPAWIADFALAIMNARSEGVCVEIAIADAWQQIREEIGKGIYLIMGLARIAPPLALFGVILQLAAGFTSRGSVAALQAGMVESRTIESAIVTLIIGLGTSTICFVGGGILRKHVRKVDKDIEHMSRSLEEAFAFIDQSPE